MSYTVLHPVIGGSSIRMFRGGAGQPALFLHGGAGLSAWTPFFQALSQHFDLIVPEHPGFGESDNPAWLNSVGDLALFYLDFLEEMNLNRVHLIGNSFGGWIASELASRDCSRLESLTLIGPAGLPPRGEQEDLFRWSYPESMRKLFYNQAIAERILSSTLSPEQLANLLKNQTTMARIAAPVGLTNPDLSRWLRRIKAPVHVVWGRHDNYCPVATSEAWIAAIPGATKTIVEDTGHLPHVESPEVTANAVLAFLNKTVSKM